MALGQHGLQFTRSRIRLGILKGSVFRRAYLLINPRLSVRLTIGTTRLAPDREPSTLILVEAESPASMEFLKNANLFLQKLNLLPLLVVQPPSDGQK